MDNIKCPDCNSSDVVCFDGNGSLSEYGLNVMTDIEPDMWQCKKCGSVFRVDIGQFFEDEKENVHEN